MYTFTYPCPHCAWPNPGELLDAGQTVACAKCRADHVVPVPKELDCAPPAVDPAEEPAATGDNVIRFDCPRCGRHFAAKPAVVGEKIRCQGCGKGVYVPDRSGGRAREPRRTSRKAVLNSSGILAVPRRRSSKGRRRPRSKDKPRESFNDVNLILGGGSSASVFVPDLAKNERAAPREFQISPLWWAVAGIIAVTIAVVLTIVL